MKNPFLKEGCLRTNASINKIVLSKIPLALEDEDLSGKMAGDIFSSKHIIDEIKLNSKAMKIDINSVSEKALTKYLNLALLSSDKEVRDISKEIISKYGKRLGIILLTLKRGEEENRIARKDWTDKCWEYWKQLDSVILTGGLASNNLGSEIKKCIEEVFYKANEKCYKIKLVEDSANVAIRGCINKIEGIELSGTFIIMDYGQSNIKRSKVTLKNNEILNIERLTPIESKYVNWEFSSEVKELQEAKLLDEFIKSTILKTIEECNNKIEKQIIISIANYVNNGQLVHRGGYGKLSLITSNYEVMLEKYFMKKLNSNYKIKLIHDGSAMAAAFVNDKNSVCLSLGTALGVGYTT